MLRIIGKSLVQNPPLKKQYVIINLKTIIANEKSATTATNDNNSNDTNDNSRKNTQPTRRRAPKRPWIFKVLFLHVHLFFSYSVSLSRLRALVECWELLKNHWSRISPQKRTETKKKLDVCTASWAIGDPGGPPSQSPGGSPGDSPPRC